ncbi:hypothetical protein WICPIJ_000044 [Wickerhamomyces pijperi]|uniref:Potassium channel domain-containing protein n=1 Tax=Wickerhamomyces pijperi TaxID=599730 RepID=A0A9P8TSH0_WICPI|nr:hypothetical protein WICPIJ_000044 [Wickerhamomyces pijperi]
MASTWSSQYNQHERHQHTSSSIKSVPSSIRDAPLHTRPPPVKHTLTSQFDDIPPLSTIPDKLKINSLQVEAGSFGFAFWYVISTYLPIFTACVCPLTDMMSIASLVSKWRIDIDNNEIHESTSVLVLNAVSLGFGAIGNLSVVLNFSKKMNYKWSQLISIIGFFLAGVLLFSALMIAEFQYFNDPARKLFRSEGFWFAVMTTILHWVCCITCFINYLGFLLGKYPADFNIYTSERGIVVYTSTLAVIFSVGAACYSKLLNLRFGECQYFTVITVTTLGYGNIVPVSSGSRAFTMVYALVGVINLGLIVTMILSMITSKGSATALSWNTVEINRRKLLADIARRENLHIDKRESFELMRLLKSKARFRQQLFTSLFAFVAYLVFWLGGAMVFHFTESWTYFDSCYFVFISLLTIGYGDFYPNSPPGKAFFVVWALGAVPLMTCLISSLGDIIYNVAIASIKTRGIDALFDRIRDDPAKDLQSVVSAAENVMGLTEMLSTHDHVTRNSFDQLSKDKKVLFHSSVSILKHLRLATLDSKENDEKLYSYEEWTKILELLELDDVDHDLFWLSDSSPLRFPIKEPNYISFLLFSKLESNLLRDIEMVSDLKLKKFEKIHRAEFEKQKAAQKHDQDQMGSATADIMNELDLKGENYV